MTAESKARLIRLQAAWAVLVAHAEAALARSPDEELRHGLADARAIQALRDDGTAPRRRKAASPKRALG